MGSGVDLLRLLEPATRPAGTPARASCPTAPIESRSFESLLEQARETATRETDGEPETQAAPPASKTAGPLSDLARVDRIENGSLRQLIGGA